MGCWVLHAWRRIKKGKWIKKLSPPKQSPIYPAQFCLVAYCIPFSLNHTDLMVHDGDRIIAADLKI